MSARSHRRWMSRRELPTIRHRVASVDGEIDEVLLELRRVARIDGARRRGSSIEIDVSHEQASQHRLHVPDDRADVDRPRLNDLLSAERQELARERRRRAAARRFLRSSRLARVSDRVVPEQTRAYDVMTVRMLLKSCATPPANCRSPPSSATAETAPRATSVRSGP